MTMKKTYIIISWIINLLAVGYAGLIVGITSDLHKDKILSQEGMFLYMGAATIIAFFALSRMLFNSEEARIKRAAANAMMEVLKNYKVPVDHAKA
jgi:uncharacterized membrane protein